MNWSLLWEKKRKAILGRRSNISSIVELCSHIVSTMQCHFKYALLMKDRVFLLSHREACFTLLHYFEFSLGSLTLN